MLGAARPRARFGVHDDQIGHEAGAEPAPTVGALGRARDRRLHPPVLATLVGDADLVLDHRVEHGEHLLQIRHVLEARERRDRRLDRRHAVLRGLAPDPVVARLRGPERVAGEGREARVHAQQLARLRPGAVDDDQRHRSLGRVGVQIDRRRPGREHDRGRARIGDRREEPRIALQLDAHDALGVEATLDHPRGADRVVALARVLEHDDPRARLRARPRADELRAHAHDGRAIAALAKGAGHAPTSRGRSRSARRAPRARRRRSSTAR